MSKIKTNKSILKRFKITGTNKILYRHSCKNHLLRKKTKKQKRKLSNFKKISKNDNKYIKLIFPN